MTTPRGASPLDGTRRHSCT
uniref:Uncharacterized protein n=1 Tax=Arundo donax TaxID=35708 RepID=A0A0A8Z2E8_ARUDO